MSAETKHRRLPRRWRRWSWKVGQAAPFIGASWRRKVAAEHANRYLRAYGVSHVG